MTEQPFTSYNSNKDILQEFQLAENSISDKSSKEFGSQISKKIWGYVIAGLGGYFYNRNMLFIENRKFSHGLSATDIQTMFQDRFDFNGKQNYIRLVWQTLQIVNRIVSGLVGRWMAKGEKIVVQAIDDLSQKDKQEQYEQIEFIIENRAQLEQLQQQSGVQMIPNEDLPADKEELLLWKQQFQRTPEEIEQELGCNEVLGANGWFDVLKSKMLHDSAETGLVGTYTCMDEQGVIHVEWLKPENIIYSYSDYEDFRNTSWRGYVPSKKISELRRMYGKEFHPENKLALTEEQLFKIAQTAKEYEAVTNLSWDWNWNGSNPVNTRPYDEWNVRCMEFELKTVDTEPYTVTTSKSTGTTYTQKGYPTTPSGKRRDKPSENQKVVGDDNINIYRGVYLPDNDILLEWGIKTNMIRPQDPKEIGNAEFSYSFYMYQNWQMTNLAIPQKIKAAVDNMILTCLKIQQVIARMRPTGAAVNTDALQEVDFGLGEEGNKAVDKKKLYDQTGDIYYRGRDAEGNPIPVPIQELANSGFLGQMQGLIQNYQFWYQTLKDELGEDPNLIQAATQPRVTAGNVQASQEMSEFATDYMYRAYAECMKITGRKISCLLNDSIKYGSKAYRNIVKQETSERQFSTDIRFLPTQAEQQRFENILNQAAMSNPELLQFLDPFRLMRIAQEDVKLAELLFRQAQKKLIIYQQQTAQQNQQATIQGQIASAQAAEQAKQQTEQVKGQMEAELKKIEGENQNKNATINMVGSILSKGLEVPAQYAPFVMAVIQNIMLPLAIENEQTRQAVIQQMQQAQEQQQQPQQDQEQIQSQQPQQEMAA